VQKGLKRETIKQISIIFLFILICTFIPCKAPETEWQRTVGEENGIRFIKNPEEPFFGELDLELTQSLCIGNEYDDNYFFYKVRDIEIDSKSNIYVLDAGNVSIQKFDKSGAYIQTIGIKGQGPGGLHNPYDIFVTANDFLYVLDNRKVVIFDDLGTFRKIVNLEVNVSEFAVTSHNTFIARMNPAQERKKSLVIIDTDGQLIQKFAEYPDVKPSVRKGQKRGSYVTFVVFHDYTPHPRFAILDEERVVYGYPLDYEINVISTSGKLLLRIYKEERKEIISQREKDKIIAELETSISQNGRTWPRGVLEEACKFPDHKPFFQNILIDEMRRLYIIKATSVLDNTEKFKIDIFDNQGNYLYKTKIPFIPELVFDGQMYQLFAVEETGEIKIIKYRIKNWDQIKSGIN